MLESVKKYAQSVLYGLDNCKDYLTDTEQFLHEQYQYPYVDQCSIDTSCFESTACSTQAITSVTCNTSIQDVTDCSIVITEVTN